MNIQKMSRKRGWLALACAFACALVAPAHAAEKPQPIKVGQTAQIDLPEDGRKDYTVSLAKGAYRLVWDAKRQDGRNSNIIGKISLLKPNGVIIENNQLGFNEIAVCYRVGTILTVPKPFVARFRINTEAATQNWFTVVPVTPAKRVPFGWGATVTPARISSDNGVGGTLEPDASVYHSITLPKGKWSISLGLQLPEGQNSNLMGKIDLLDAQGFAKEQRFVNVNEIDNQARKEGIITVSRPTTYLLCVTSGDSSKTYTYDVTIEPAS